MMFCVATATAAFLAAWASPPAEAQVDPAAIIDNGVVQLGVNPEGHLGVPGGTPSSGEGTTDVGIRYLPTNAEAITPGCICEGWGVADDISDATGFVNGDDFPVSTNITPVEFTTTDTTAHSVVDIGSTFKVTHDYHPSAASPNLYEVSVTIQNTSTDTVNARYRRVLDWDVEPTAFEEVVTANKGTASNLLFNSNDGFETSDPLVTPDGAEVDPYFTGNFGDKGPADHGALFDLGFDSLAAGQAVSFNIYLGATGTEADAEDALTDVGAEAFSLGEPSTQDGPTLGTPNTFIMGFQGIGGPAITDFDPVLSLPANITTPATSTSGEEVTYTSPTATDAVDGTVPVSCEPASGSTFPLGKTIVRCSATDSSGNEAGGSFEVNVLYSWSGLVQPINGGTTLNTTSDDTSLFKLGSTIPVRFELTGASADITNATASISAARVSASIQSGAVSEGRQPKRQASSGSAFSYDATSGQYVYYWGTKGLPVGTYRLSINLGDDTINEVLVSLNRKG